MAGRRPPHVARLSPARPRRGRRSARFAPCKRQRAGPAARSAGQRDVRQLRGLAADGARAREGAVARARRDQGEHALHRAPRGLHRLHRREALRRARRSHRGTSFHRALHVVGLQRARRGNAALARQGRRHRSQGRIAPWGPPREGAGPCAGDVSTRRAVPDPRRRTVRNRHGRRRAGRTPAPAAVHVARPVRPVHLVHGLRAARGLLHRPAREVPAHPHDGAGWCEHGIRRAFERRGAGAHPLHGTHDARRDSRVRAQGHRAATRRGRAAVGR